MECNDLDVSSSKSSHPQAFTLPDKALLNVSGSRFEVMWSLIEMRHLTRLEKLHKCLIEDQSWEGVCDGYDEEKKEYFFQRDAVVFNSVVCFYKKGKIHIPKDVCVEHFQRECEYWGIGLKEVAECCHHHYQQEMEVIDNMKKIKSVFQRNVALVARDLEQEQLDHAKWLRLRKRVWDLFENPNSSRAAKVSNHNWIEVLWFCLEHLNYLFLNGFRMKMIQFQGLSAHKDRRCPCLQFSQEKYN